MDEIDTENLKIQSHKGLRSDIFNGDRALEMKHSGTSVVLDITENI